MHLIKGVAWLLNIRLALMDNRQVKNADLHIHELLVAEEVIIVDVQGKF